MLGSTSPCKATHSRGFGSRRNFCSKAVAFSGGKKVESLGVVEEVEIEEEREELADDSCPPHGMMTFVGRRGEMEDALTAVPSFFRLQRLNSVGCDHHFFAVYDGHGGSEAADFCKMRLHVAISEELMRLVEEAGIEYEAGKLDFSQWKKVLLSSFQKVDGEITGLCSEDEHPKDTEGKKPLLSGNVGSTAIVGVINRSQIIIANCGDCRAVLSRGGKSIAMSSDHKPDRKDELARVEAAGGQVIFWNGYRVLGVLAMSRALGDRHLKPFIIADPEVTCLDRSPEDEFLILASDGLWDVLSNETVCRVTRLCLAGKVVKGFKHDAGQSPAASAAAFLTRLAFSRGSNDNISVLIIDLRSHHS